MYAAAHKIARKLTLVALLTISMSKAQADPSLYQHVLRSTAFIASTNGEPIGSGVLVDLENQLVLTNYHVVDDAKELLVFFSAYDENGQLLTDHRIYQQNRSALGEAGIAMVGRVVGRWKSKDLALLKLSHLPIEAQAIPLAAAGAQPGENIHSVGNSGVVSTQSLWRYTRGAVRNVFQLDGLPGYVIKDAYVLETDSPINGGDSGGPMVNDQGELVGLVMGGEKSFRQTADGRSRESRLVTHAIELREVRALLEWYYTQILNIDLQSNSNDW
jgi:S1-C subfamily serine protease